MEDTSLQDVLSKALKMEEKGFTFYQEASQKSNNNITKKMFSFLADNEMLHIESIEKFCDALKTSAELPDLKLESVKSKREEEGKIFSKEISELKEKIKPGDDDVKACEFAMEFENQGHAYYKNMLKDAQDEKVKTLLEFLVQEESKHYQWLSNTHSYLTDSQNWYMYEEGSFPQG